jgi:leader peptidase (prepilin peptidase)/N-methyltransferase
MLLQESPALYLGLALLLGLVVGSFLNVLILRLPARMQAEWATHCEELAGKTVEHDPRTWFGLRFLITPPSTCPSCGHSIRAWENIPVLSYLLLKGRCSACQTPIGRRYPAVELATGILTLVTASQFAPGVAAAGALVLTWGLIALSVIDIDHQQLPDQLTLPLLWLGLLFNLGGVYTDLTSAVLGAVAAYLFLWFVYHLFVSLTGKEGMGYGDFKLFAVFGAWFGWQLLPQILLVASVVGAAVGIGLIVLRGRDRRLPIPFGPYLAVAGWIALLWGDDINRVYLQLSGLG